MFQPGVGLSDLDTMSKGTLMEHLGVEYLEIGTDYIRARMPVDRRTFQPLRMLHGGASVALAESIGSMAANISVDPERFYCVGLEINANHIKAVRSGFVYGIAKPLHMGTRTQVWEIHIQNEQGGLVCISRLTMAVIERKSLAQ